MHDDTHRTLGTYTTKASFEKALFLLHEAGIPVIVHLILGLPGETRNDMLATADYIAHLPVSGVKLQLLHVLRDTELAARYQQNPFPIMEMEEYLSLVMDILERLPAPEMVPKDY